MDDKKQEAAKKEAVKLAIEQIEKQYGKGAIMRLGGSEGVTAVPAIPTGSVSLDLALGVGGIPGESNGNFWSRSVGKTTLVFM